MKYCGIILISLLLLFEHSNAQNIDAKFNYMSNKKGINLDANAKHPNLPVLPETQKQKSKKYLTATDKIYRPAQTIECYMDTSKITYSYNQKGNITCAFREYLAKGKWVTGSRISYTYDENDNEIQRLCEYYGDSTWDNYDRFINTFDGNGNLLTSTYDRWQYDCWMHYTNYVYTYDNNQNVLEKIQQSYDHGDWKDAYRYSYTYDANGNILTYIYSDDIKSKGWDLRTRYEYAYDNEGRRILFAQESWLNGAWEKYWQDTYTYNEAGKLRTLTSENWECLPLKQRYTYSYNGVGNMDTSLYEIWDNSCWRDSSLIIYTYNGNNLLDSETRYNRADSLWVYDQRSTYEYRGNCNVHTVEMWVDTSWFYVSQTIDSLDINNNVLASTNKRFSNGKWSNFTMYNYNYDENSNTTKAEFFYWDNNRWNSQAYNLLLVYNNYQDTIRFIGNMKSMTYVNFTGVEDNIQTVGKYSISQNYPNPFNPATTINYQLPKAGMVVIIVYDILGSEVKTLVNEYKQPGSYSVNFDASNLSSGIYFYRIISGNYSASKKMVLIK